MKKKAIVLFSGGIDSTTLLYLAKFEGYEVYAISFNYGQRHSIEIEAASKIISILGINEHKVVNLGIGQLGGSSLTDHNIEIPLTSNSPKTSSTYVPARNSIFLTVAMGWAEVIDATHIFIGATAEDFPQYPDCGPDYLKAFQNMANLATKTGREGKKLLFDAPLINLYKHDIIAKASKLGIPLELTVTCYQATDDGFSCGKCDSCQKRRLGFKKAGVPDPTKYIE